MKAAHHKTADKAATKVSAKNPPAAGAELSELRPGQSVELLKELHILTREGG